MVYDCYYLFRSNTSTQVKPDVITFTSVIHACAGPKGNWEKAYQVIGAYGSAVHVEPSGQDKIVLGMNTCGNL